MSVKWRGFEFEPQTRNPFHKVEDEPSEATVRPQQTDTLGVPTTNTKRRLQQPTEDESGDEFDLELSELWRERLARSNAKMVERRKLARKEATPTQQDRIARLELELQRSFEVELKRLEEQQQGGQSTTRSTETYPPVE